MKRPQQPFSNIVLCTLIVCTTALLVYASYNGMKLNFEGPSLELEFRNGKIIK
jgi:hypothetical protein